MLSIQRLAVLVLLLACGACAPTFDWREARVDGSLQAYLPCRPTSLTRELMLADQVLVMQLLSCSTGGLTFGLSRIDAGEAARVAPLLEALREALATNLRATAGVEAGGVAAVGGMTPHPGAGRFRVIGSTPAGAPLRASALIFAHRSVVYQATVIGERFDQEVIESFFDSLRLPG